VKKWLSAYKSCNISETGKIGPRLYVAILYNEHQKVPYARFRLVPKSTTLDDLEGSLCILFQSICPTLLLITQPLKGTHQVLRPVRPSRASDFLEIAKQWTLLIGET